MGFWIRGRLRLSLKFDRAQIAESVTKCNAQGLSISQHDANIGSTGR